MKFQERDRQNRQNLIIELGNLTPAERNVWIPALGGGYNPFVHGLIRKYGLRESDGDGRKVDEEIEYQKSRLPKEVL